MKWDDTSNLRLRSELPSEEQSVIVKAEIQGSLELHIIPGDRIQHDEHPPGVFIRWAQRYVVMDSAS